jgi:putative SOS response-associated peptidase YedK
MCGRFAITLAPEVFRAAFGYVEQPNFPPRYNIAPTQPVPVVRIESGTRHFTLMRWGFLPAFVKDPKDFPLVINIRRETVREKPSFRGAFRHRRALMPVDGFYEWQTNGREKQPFLIRRPDRGPFAFAALWENWSSADGSEIDTVAMLTGEANGTVAAVHHRCPVILDPKDYDRWLDPTSSPDEIASLLKPPPDDFLELVAVGKAVNSVANDRPDIQEPLRASPVAKEPAPALATTAEAEAASERKPAPRRKAANDDQGNLF